MSLRRIALAATFATLVAGDVVVWTINVRPQGVVMSATGSGKLASSSSGMLNFSFSAMTDADGETHGQLQSFDTSTGGKLHAEITCLSVAENVAGLSGFVKSSNVGLGPGEPIAFTVQDNGEGKDAVDVMSNVRGGGGTPDCNTFWPLEFPVQNGNIQVQTGQ